MAISATSVPATNTLNQLRTQFNNLVTDVTGIEAGTIEYNELNTTSISSSTFNVKEDGVIVFEGATNDDFETTLTVADPTADRTITLPNATGTVALTNSFTHFHSSAQTVTSAEATTNASGTVDYTFSDLSGAIHYVAFLNRTLMRASEYSVSGTTLTVNSGVLATDDQIEVTGISV